MRKSDQSKRAASLGVMVSMAPFQCIDWGDSLGGAMFKPAIGSQWQAVRSAFDAGVRHILLGKSNERKYV